MKKIAIVTSGHFSKDDRLYYKFALSLQKYGLRTVIISTLEDLAEEDELICIDSFNSDKLNRKQKSIRILQSLDRHQPDIVICAEPFTVFPCKRYKQKSNRNLKIIMDITELYPENIISKMSGLKKYLSGIILWIINILAVNLSDSFIFGEGNKARRYQFIRPGLKFKTFGYYVPKSLLPHSDHQTKEGNSFTITYSGQFTKSRGFFRFLQVAWLLGKELPDTFSFRAVGKFLKDDEKNKFESIVNSGPSIKIELIQWESYVNYLSILSESDILVDLREKSPFFENSLPIKIFDYIAVSKPFIFSDLKIFREYPELKSLGFLINPYEISDICAQIKYLCSNREQYQSICDRNNKLYQEMYNWEILEEDFVKYVTS